MTDSRARPHVLLVDDEVDFVASLGQRLELRGLPTLTATSGPDALEILRGQPVDVEYRMHLRQGAWLAYDVKIEGISLISNYRSSFATVARNKGIDGLIEEIAALNATRAKRS